ncbi:MAG: phosphoribosyltransferase family protein [Thermoproteus sp.]
MSAGLFAIYHFGGEANLYPLAYYGLKAMANRGDRAVAYILSEAGLRKLEVDLDKEPETATAPGRAAVGCVSTEECCWEHGGSVVCSFGPERPHLGEKPRRTAYVGISAEGRLYAYRPPELWHLAVGAHGFDFALVATETAAIEVLGGEARRSLRGGELLVVDRYGVGSSGGAEPEALCALDLIYAARLDSKVDGVEVAQVRSALAKRLAARVKADVDVVVGVPETGVYYASWLARELGRWCHPAFVATARGRSALLDEIKERIATVQLKANVVESAVRGQRVLLVDDSLISGLTVRQISQLLRGKAGAKEVHVAVASPPLRRRCPYGVKMPDESHMVFNHLSREEVEAALEVDSLVSLDLEDLKAAVGRPLCVFCLAGRA